MRTRISNRGCGDDGVEEQEPLDATEIPHSNDVPVVDGVDAEQGHGSEDTLTGIEGRAPPGEERLPCVSGDGVLREVRSFEVLRVLRGEWRRLTLW